MNVGNEIHVIDTEKTLHGGQLKAKQQIEKRERLSRRKRWEIQDEDVDYSGKQLDRDVVNPDQIRTVVRTFRDKIPELFPGREEVPKTLIFAKTDSHADDIIQTVREEFAEGNRFCKKITYKAEEDPKSTLAQFRNDYYPRRDAGTDVKPLEIEHLPEETEPSEAACNPAREQLLDDAARVFNGELIELIDSIRRDKEQTIDDEGLDTVIRAEWEGDAQENAEALTSITCFASAPLKASASSTRRAGIRRAYCTRSAPSPMTFTIWAAKPAPTRPRSA